MRQFFFLLVMFDVCAMFEVNINPLLCSICDDRRLVRNYSSPAVSHVGSRQLILQEYTKLNVVLKFNVTLHGKWTVYSYAYNMEMLGNTLSQSAVAELMAACYSEK